MIGQTIAHYKILEKLGEGGMGIVYKALDTTLDRPVSLKFLPRYLTSDATEKERFYHEAHAASALNHPNITTIYEITEFEQQLYLAMEFVEGKTLKKLIEQEELSIRKVFDIAIQICEGLAAAAEKGIVHRDIKSDNIMVTPKGQVKIMDFGLAKVKGATKITKAGSTLGTAAYMSPEQAQGEEVDHRADIFSFGVVLYELLTTKLPFRGEHQAALMYSLINEDPQPIARFNEKVSPETERVVAKALAKDREDRYQHIDDMLADLRRERKHLEYARAGYVTQASAAQIPPVQPPKRNLLKYLIPAGALIVAGLLVAIFNPFNFQITTQKGTAASGKNSVAVMYFENIPDPDDKDHTGEMLTNLLTTSLFQVRDIEVISRERLYDIQKELSQGDARSITPSMATNVAKRAGVSMMVLGTILQKEPSLAVTYRLIEVESGKILSTQRLSGYSPDRIFALVDTLAHLVQNDLHVTPSAVPQTKSVASVTTSSPEAYRSYLEGVELNSRFYASEATAAFRRAIELDSNFAMAYFQLANVALGTLTNQERSDALKSAYALSGSVTEREKLFIQASYVGQVENNIPKAISLLETLVEHYPHEQYAYQGLGVLYQIQGQYEKVFQSFSRGLEVDSLDKGTWNSVAYSSAALNRKKEALNAIDHYIQLAPAEPNPYDSKGDVYAFFDQRDSAVVWWQKAVSFRSDFPSQEKLGSTAVLRQDYTTAEEYYRRFAASKNEQAKVYEQMLALVIVGHRGELEKLRSQLRDFLASHRAQKLPGWPEQDLAILAAVDYELRDYPAMVKDAEERSDEKKSDPTDVLGGKPLLAIAYSLNGNVTMANQVLAKIEQLQDQGPFFIRAAHEYALAVIQFEKGNYAEALRLLDEALKLAQPHHAPLYHHAVSLLKTGRTAEAVTELKRLTQWSPVGYGQFDLDRAALSEYWLSAAVKAHYWLGVAYEEQRLNKQALDEYGKFLDIWKDADFKSAELQDAKARVAKLKGMAAR